MEFITTIREQRDRDMFYEMLIRNYEHEDKAITCCKECGTMFSFDNSEEVSTVRIGKKGDYVFPYVICPICGEKVDLVLDRYMKYAYATDSEDEVQLNGCNCASSTDEYNGWKCSVSDGACMFLYPNAEKCAELYGEGPLATGGEDTVESKIAKIRNTIKHIVVENLNLASFVQELEIKLIDDDILSENEAYIIHQIAMEEINHYLNGDKGERSLASNTEEILEYDTLLFDLNIRLKVNRDDAGKFIEAIMTWDDNTFMNFNIVDISQEESTDDEEPNEEEE